MAIVDFALAVLSRVDAVRRQARLMGDREPLEAAEMGALAFLLWCRAMGRSWE